MKLENSGHWSEMVLNIISLLFKKKIIKANARLHVYTTCTLMKMSGLWHIHVSINKGNNKITEFRTILQRESQNS
jgi:hypothetical protein